MDLMIPDVIDKSLGKKKFNPILICKSLLKETDISKNDAKDTMKQVVRILIGANLKIVTSPMIREITNTVLLQKGLEMIRLQYTRIGFPLFDLKKRFKERTNFSDEIVKHVRNEYRNVLNLIKTIQTAEQSDLQGLKIKNKKKELNRLVK